ncbi:MAG TPA: hypothetical protein VKA55_06150 [Gammaproteobacteria bacterium]|nr:hypothetical protein [Gammaproteobacteria bacterium]
MYKRRGRILFLDGGTGTRARMAEAWARALGARWVEPAAASLHPGGRIDHGLSAVMAESGVAVQTDPCRPWAEARDGRWDLVVSLEAGEGEDWEGLLEGVRCKRWRLDGLCPGGDGEDHREALRVCRDVVRDRVDGLLGGFRMKAREDDKGPRLPNDGAGGRD